MKICRTIASLQKALPAAGKKEIGFVPTMGFLHEGHLSLVRACREENELAAVSIYVNPAQFAAAEDLQRYPRDAERDIALLEKEKVDVLFMPGDAEMYPPPYRTYVRVEGLEDKLCGASRPGHFRGVATVVLKLFQLLRPQRAYFGQKDAQQAVIVRQMVRDLGLPLRLRVLPIVARPRRPGPVFAQRLPGPGGTPGRPGPAALPGARRGHGAGRGGGEPGHRRRHARRACPRTPAGDRLRRHRAFDRPGGDRRRRRRATP